MSTFNINTVFQQANVLVPAHTTLTVYGSSLVTMSPVSAISSVQITQVALNTPDTRFGTVSCNRALPYTAPNNGTLVFSVVYDNASPISMANTTVGKAVTAVATSANPQLAAGSSDTNTTSTTTWNSSSVQSISAGNWFYNYVSQSEHARLYTGDEI